MYHKTLSYRIFSVFNTIFLVALSFICIAPLLHVLAVSLSDKAAADGNLVGLWPVRFTFAAYERTITNDVFLGSIWVSVQRTVLGTGLTLLLAFMAAYTLAKENTVFKARTAYAWIFVFTMLFAGGLVPSYILIQQLHLMNTFWVLILPGAVNVYSTILLMNFFRGIPKELEESAFIDGAGHFRILFNIFLPISLPAIATIAMFSIVGHWNAWFDGILYLNDRADYPLASFLQTVIIQRDLGATGINAAEMALLSQKTVTSAQIFVGALPVLLVYPFLQKYFVKGLVLGSVKQ